MTGLYVTIEGIDGAGKSTLVEGLRNIMEDASVVYPDNGSDGALFTAEPYDDIWTGEAVRTAVRLDTGPVTDSLLFAADRATHLSWLVTPALDNGQMVVSDRGHDSTYAYQVPRLVDSRDDMTTKDATLWLDQLYKPWNREPDLTLWLDVPVDEAYSRMSGEEKWADRDYFERVARGYMRRYDSHPTRFRAVDASQEPEDVLDDAVALIAGASP